MAGTAKVSMFFEDLEGYGWSENWYYPWTISIDDAKAPAQALFKARLGLCAAGIQGLYLRVSDDSVLGDSDVDTTSYQVGNGVGNNPSTGGNQKNPSIIKPGSAGSPVGPNDCLTIRLEMGFNYHSIKYFRGLGNDVITSPPGPVIAGDFLTAWNAYKKLLVNGLWQLKVRSKTGTSQKTPILGIVGGLTTPIVITTAQAHQIQAGQVFRIGGFRNMPGIRGTYVATSVTATTISVAGPPIASVQIPNKGYTQLLSPAYLAITSCQADEQAYRKSGRPFGQRPGRRKARPVGS